MKYLALLFLLVALPVQAQLRLPVARAVEGLHLTVTHDFDRIIKFEQDTVADAWISNPVLFLVRFNKGGRVILLQTSASPKELKVLPQLGRTLGTLTVQMRSGQVLVFFLQYTPNPLVQPILTLVAPPQPVPQPIQANLPVLPPAIEAYRRFPSSPPPVPARGIVTQQGFTSPIVVPQTFVNIGPGSTERVEDQP
ncbi:hypothetical protein [Anthocerotibacter panamensis]|uniref:hypothetical protein n=1 Tax=Anthocerotibacter panamensis TaxID=2857077 RepID=UPI001C4017D8|nr:hypothetical protein [Anthocerotibacter panamensis]